MEYSSNLDLSSSIKGGPGSLANDKVPTCKFCRQNGFPHEAIIFKPIEGRILADGRVATTKWLVCDYFQPWKQHKHKPPMQLRLKQKKLRGEE